MADPFSIAAGVVGVLAPSLHLIRLLRDDLRNISDASSTVKTLGKDVDSVEAALKSLGEISQAQWTALGPSVEEQSTAAIRECTKTCEKFRADLQRWTRHSTGTISWRDRAALGFFRKNEIKSLSKQLQKHQIALNLMISTANLSTKAVVYRSLPPRPQLCQPRNVAHSVTPSIRQPGSCVALTGLGGVGKSQLAIEHCYRTQEAAAQKNEPVWIFWVHAGTPARLEEGFKAIADTAKIPGRDQSDTDILELVERWLHSEQNGPWFLVVDNADDASVLFDASQPRSGSSSADRGKRALWTYLPQCSHGSILITTRDKGVGLRLTEDSQSVIQVPPMDKGHALSLLASKVGNLSDMDASVALVEALEYMPLAISQAGAYIHRRAPRMSVRKYLDSFRGSESEMSNLLNRTANDRDAGDLRRDPTASNSIIMTWQISFEAIHSERKSAADLLSFMSFFDRQSIPESLIRPFHPDSSESSDTDAPEETGDETFDNDIVILHNYALISINETGDAFEMHRLVQLSTKRWLDAFQKTERFMGQFLWCMAHSFPMPEYKNWETCQKLFPHAQNALDYRPSDEESLKDWAEVLFCGGEYQIDQGRYYEAEIMAEKARATRTELLGEENGLTLESTRQLGRIFFSKGLYEQAESLQVQVMEKRKVALGLEATDTLTAICELAHTYMFKGRFKEAELLHLQVMEARKRVIGLEHPDTLTSMGSLADTYDNQGRWEEAGPLQLQVMEARKRVLGAEHPDTLVSMGNLASTYRSQGRWSEAETVEVQVLEVRRRVLGAEHPDTLISMGNLASTYWNQGRWSEAKALEVQVLETRGRVLGAEHPQTLVSMNNLATTWYAIGLEEKAIELMDRCAQARCRILGPEHPHTVVSLEWLRDWRGEEAEQLSIAEDIGRMYGFGF